MPNEPFSIVVYPPRTGEFYDPSLFTVLPPLPRRQEEPSDDAVATDPPMKLTEHEEALWRRPLAQVHDRSSHLFLLFVLLKQHGLRDDLAMQAIMKHPFSIDKYFGRTQREAERIRDNFYKNGGLRAASGADEVVIEHIVSWNWLEFMSRPTRVEWAVQNTWLHSSVGFIGGPPKAYKSFTSLDLALSVLTGASFLDTFAVKETGPVLLVQEEDPHAVIQERIGLIAQHKGLDSGDTLSREQHDTLSFPNLPLTVFNQQGIRLEDDGKIGQVVAAIRRERPTLVILDPFINLITADQTDEYKGSAIANALWTFKQWREEFGCSVLVVHHTRKASYGERGGEDLYGSFAFHAWLESALHIKPVVEENEQVREVLIEREFKAAPSGSRLRVQWDVQTERPGAHRYAPQVGTHVPTQKDTLLDAIAENPDSDLKQLVAITGIPTKQLQPMLQEMLRAKRLRGISHGGGLVTYVAG